MLPTIQPTRNGTFTPSLLLLSCDVTLETDAKDAELGKGNEIEGSDIDGREIVGKDIEGNEIDGHEKDKSVGRDRDGSPDKGDTEGTDDVIDCIEEEVGWVCRTKVRGCRW